MRPTRARVALLTFASLSAGVALVAGVLTAAAGSLLLLDRVNSPPVVTDPGIASIDGTKHSRLLILHLDSWRYETAIDTTLMPQVARLRTRGASWKMETVFEGFTVPAVQAAFTGHAETQLVNFIRNFRFRALGQESFFQDASRLGKRTLVVGLEPFAQFGPYFETRLPDPRGLTMYQTDRLRPGIALKSWLDERFDVVLCHYESSDWVAHEEGIHTERYRHEFAYADSLVATFAAALGPSDYLLVYGDHGHSATGEHKTGLDIPTFGLLLGPDVSRGVTVGPMETGNIRYIASHAMGISLRPAPYDVKELSRMLPVSAGSATHAGAAERHLSLSATDYAMALAVLVGALALALVLVRRVKGDGLSARNWVVLGALFSTELALQHYRAPRATIFPVVLIVIATFAPKLPRLSRAVAIVLGAWFAARMAGVAWVAAPPGLAGLIPLYVLAIAAKAFVLDGIAGRARWRSTVAWTTAITLVELRAWDSPWPSAALLLAGVAVWLRLDNDRERRVAGIAILSALLYFTLRLPLYQLAWIDLFFGALWLVAVNGDGVWVDTLIVTGSFALASGWLASGLEWGFLYTMFPAHVVEHNVPFFIPFILAKLPLLMVLTLCVAVRRPTRRLVEILLLYTGLRFALAWILRLGGAPSVEIWPLAEQGIYLTTFVLAGVVWGWWVALPARRTGTPAPSRA